MILKKYDLHPFFGFWSIYGTGSYILSVTEEGKWNHDVKYVALLLHAKELLKWKRIVPLLEEFKPPIWLSTVDLSLILIIIQSYLDRVLYYYRRHDKNVTCRLILMSMKQSICSLCIGSNRMDIIGISGNFHHNPAGGIVDEYYYGAHIGYSQSAATLWCHCARQYIQLLSIIYQISGS